MSANKNITIESQKKKRRQIVHQLFLRELFTAVKCRDERR